MSHPQLNREAADAPGNDKVQENAVRKILVIIRSTPMHAVGGMEALTWDLCLEMCRQGREVTVLTTPLTTNPHDAPSHKNLTITYLQGKTGRYSRRWRRGLKRYVSALSLEDWEGILGVSAAAFAVARSSHRGQEARKRTSPVVMQAHGTAALELKSRLRHVRILSVFGAVRDVKCLIVDLASYRRLGSIISVGPAVSRSLESWPIVLATGGLRIDEIRNAVAEEEFAYSIGQRLRVRGLLGVEPQTRVFLIAGRMSPQKHRSRTWC